MVNHQKELKTDREALPESGDWNQFWNGNPLESSFTKMSWSKRRILKILRPYLKPGSRVLDAGCGSGFFSETFCDMGLKVVSLDYSEVALEMTKQRTQNRCEAYVRADLISGGLSLEELTDFDLVFTDGLLEHFLEDEQLRLIARFGAMKKKEGIIATFAPNRFHPWQIIRPYLMPGVREVPFTERTLTALHRKFEIIDKGGLNFLPSGFSPEALFARRFGMILYCLAR
jgi:2-polyprenyl-3-methyl-5-hydroxy-6-metoxy-1,4-benzoquinol methylase